MECLITFEDITSETYCEYQTSPSNTWHVCLCGSDMVEEMRRTQFGQYIDELSTDCAATLTRMVEKGPPVWVAEETALAIPESDTHVCKLWYCSDGKERNAKLEGAVEGAERDALWNQHKELLQVVKAAKAAEDS